MNRAEMRDWLRRMLNVQPPIDTTLVGAKAGDAPSWQPDPSNPRLNQAITDACATLNRRLRLTDRQDVVSIAVSAQTANGPYWTNLATGIDNTISNTITAVASANWNDGSTRTVLKPTTIEELRRDYAVPDGVAPSTPVWYVVERYRVAVHPAPSTAGTLELHVTTGLFAPQSDIEGFKQLPTEYDQCVLYTALVDVARGMGEDAAMAQVAQTYWNDAQRGEDELARWVASTAGPERQPSFVPAQYVRPSGYYGRRR